MPQDPNISSSRHSDFDMTQPIPHEIGGCTLSELIGKGGMGSVYKGYHQTLHTTVAIKLLSSKLTNDYESIERFFREARSIAKLDHENLVRVLNVGEEKGQYFIIMQYVDGKTLKALLKEKGPLPVPYAVNYMLQSCRGLQEAHNKSIIHRDIKPDNLMVTQEGRIKITDFGLAREVDTSASLTQQGEILGSPYYMSPEQCKGKKDLVDHRTDIYSLGATFYHLLSGCPPFTAETPILIMMKHVKEPAPPLLSEAPHLPPNLAQIVDRMMLKNREDRYSSCLELEQELKRCFGMDAVEIKPPSDIQQIPVSTPRPTHKFTFDQYRTPPAVPVAPSSKPFLKNYAIEETVSVDFRDQAAKAVSSSYVMEETIRVPSSSSSLSSKKKKKPPSKFPIVFFFFFLMFGGVVGVYYHFYLQVSTQANTLLTQLQKETPFTLKQAEVPLEEWMNQKAYQEIFRTQQARQQYLRRLKEIQHTLEEFQEKNRLFFVESIFSDSLITLNIEQQKLQSFLKEVEITLHQERLLVVEQQISVLEKGRWEQFIQNFEQTQILLEGLLTYEQNPYPKFNGYLISESELPTQLRTQIPKLFYEIRNAYSNHQQAKNHLEQAKSFWNSALEQQDFTILDKCLETYQNLYQKIPETDYHRQAEVPLLLFPVFDKELEPELANQKELLKTFQIETKNAQLVQVLSENDGPAFLFSHALPIRNSPDKIQVYFKLQYPGFQPIEYYIFSDQIDQLRHRIPLKRKFREWKFPNASFLLRYQDLLLFVSKQNEMYQLQAINSKGELFWTLPLPGELTFPPVIHNDLLFFGLTKSLEEEFAEAECFLYRLQNLDPPSKIAAIRVPGGLKSSGCFLPDQNVISFAGILPASNAPKKAKLKGCIRFHSLEDLSVSNALPLISLDSLVTTDLNYLPEEMMLYFGTKTAFYGYSPKGKNEVWREKIEKETTFSFQPILNQRLVAILKNGKENAYLSSYTHKKGDPLKSFDLRGNVPFPPQLQQNVFSVTTRKNLFSFNVETFDVLVSYASPNLIASSAFFEKGYYYFIKENGRVVAINANGEFAWEYPLELPLDSRLSGSPMVFQEMLILPYTHGMVLFDLFYPEKK